MSISQEERERFFEEEAGETHADMKGEVLRDATDGEGAQKLVEEARYIFRDDLLLPASVTARQEFTDRRREVVLALCDAVSASLVREGGMRTALEQNRRDFEFLLVHGIPPHSGATARALQRTEEWLRITDEGREKHG